MERPTVGAEFVASMIESTPDRVRRRLDRTPDIAASWDWQASQEAWSVDAGGETVTLPRLHVAAVEQLACTCLLSPRCFHVLACLTQLEVAIVEAKSDEEEVPEEEASSKSSEDDVEPSEKQRHAARELVKHLAWLLRVGVVNAGVVVQSGLLRAIHQCRAEGLHRLGTLGLKIITGTNEVRARAPTADPAQLAEDMAAALETVRHVQRGRPIRSFWIGTARRKQLPARPRKLHGLFAEPILTRSGFAGAAVYFLGEDDRIYTTSDVRPGDAQLARDAYLGGIEIGPMTQPAKQLARGLYLGTDLTASADGRLGRGKGIKIVEQGKSTWEVEAVQGRFRRSLTEQLNAAYSHASLPDDAQPAGWDFVFLHGTVLGAAGPELILSTADGPLRLAIENEREFLCFRENLRMLCHAPELRLQVIARLNLLEPRVVFPLAVAHFLGDFCMDDEPRFDLPASMAGRICLGFDEIQRHYLLNAQSSPAVLIAQGVPPEEDHPLASLRRRWISAMLSGIASQLQGNVKMLAAETAALERIGLITGAALLNGHSSVLLDKGPDGIDMFLATAVYLRTCSHELAKSRAMLEN